MKGCLSALTHTRLCLIIDKGIVFSSGNVNIS